MKNLNIFTQTGFQKVNYNYFDENDYSLSINKGIDEICFYAIAKEPFIWPSFGLVNFNNSGSHNDMDYSLLIKSAKSIVPFFRSCFQVGCNISYSNEERLFIIKNLGIKAEATMLEATNNINTHKGVIFLLSILCTSLGISTMKKYNCCCKKGFLQFSNMLLEVSYDFSKKCISNEIKNEHSVGLSQTYGEWVQSKYKINGIRGIVINNFRIIRYGLIIYLNLVHKFKSKDLILGQLRLYFLAYSNDTNIIKRAGIYNAYKIKLLAYKSLKSGGIFTMKGLIIINELEQLMEKNKWSAAASGDLIIIILFMVSSYESRFINNWERSFNG